MPPSPPGYDQQKNPWLWPFFYLLHFRNHVNARSCKRGPSSGTRMKHPCYNYYRVNQAFGTQERAHCELFLGLLRRKLLLGKKSTQKVIIMSQTDGHQKGQIQGLEI